MSRLDSFAAQFVLERAFVSLWPHFGRPKRISKMQTPSTATALKVEGSLLLQVASRDLAYQLAGPVARQQECTWPAGLQDHTGRALIVERVQVVFSL